MTCQAPRCCSMLVIRDLYCWASSSACGPAPVSSTTVPSTHSAAPGPVVPEPILTRDVPRTTAPGCPPGSRPTCSTTARVPTPASPRSASRGTSSTRAFISERMPGTCRDGIRAASMAAPTSVCDVSSGTTMPGSTTSSSSGSTGSVSVSLIDGLQSLSHTHSRKKSPVLFPLPVRPQRSPREPPGAASRPYFQPSKRRSCSRPDRHGGNHQAVPPGCDGGQHVLYGGSDGAQYKEECRWHFGRHRGCCPDPTSAQAAWHAC